MAGGIGGIRQWVNENSAVVTVITLLVLVVVVYFIVKAQFGPGRLNSDDMPVYYYDTVTKERIPGVVDRVPPFVNDKGNECVRVAVFSCGECTEGEMFNAYFEKYTDEMKQMIEQRVKEEGPEVLILMQGPMMMEEGTLRSLDGETWYPVMDPAVRSVMMTINQERCGGAQAIGCTPPR